MPQRRLLLQLQVSLDMYMAITTSELSFLGTQWSADVSACVNELMKPVDHILLGHVLAAGFIPHWLARPAHESDASIDNINLCAKTIFSHSLTEPDASWQSPGSGKVEVVNGDLAAEVKRLKDSEGGSIISYGGVQLAQALLSEGLVDEVFLVVNPVALGEGKKLFTKMSKWELIEAKHFECGLALLRWKPKPE